MFAYALFFANAVAIFVINAIKGKPQGLNNADFFLTLMAAGGLMFAVVLIDHWYYTYYVRKHLKSTDVELAQGIRSFDQKKKNKA